MKQLRFSLSAMIAALALLMTAWPVRPLAAAQYTWNDAGTGTWDTTTANWKTGASSVVWTNLNDAVFGSGVDGTFAVNVALATGTVATLNFNNSGYTLSAASLTTLTVNNAANTIMVASGKSATIGNNVILATPVANKSHVIAGGGTLNFSSGSTLNFNGNVASNTLSINATTVNLAAGSVLNTAQTGIAAGSALFLNGDLNVNGGTANIYGTFGIGQTSSSGIGTLTINSGTVSATSVNGVRFGASTASQGGTVNLDGGTLQAYRLQKGTGAVTSSILNLNGGTLVSATTLTTFITGLDRVNVRNGGAKIDTAGWDVTISQGLLHSNIGGDAATDGGLTKSGLGTLTMAGDNTYSGPTLVNEGTLLFTGSLSGNGNLTAAGGAQITVNSSITDASLNNAGLTKNGSGTLTLAGSNSYTGATTINSGTLALTHASAINGGGSLTFSGGVLQHSSSNKVDYSGQIVNSGSAITIDTNNQSVSYASGLASSNIGGLTKNGLGTLSLSGTTAYGGPTVVNAGTLTISGSLFGNGSYNVAAGAQGTINSALTNASVNNAGLTKDGSGTLTLNGAGSYTGPTVVNAGKLAVMYNRSAASTYSVSAGAQLHVEAGLSASNINLSGLLSGLATAGGPIGAVTVASTGTIAPGTAAGGLGAFAFVSLTGTTGAVLSLQLGKTTAGTNPTVLTDFERVSVGGSVLLNNMTLDLQTTANTGNIELGDMFFLVNNQGGSAIQGAFAGLADGTQFDWQGYQFRISYTANWTGTYGTSSMTGGNDVALLAVPEPGTWAMLLGGFGMLLSIQRLRKNRVGAR